MAERGLTLQASQYIPAKRVCDQPDILVNMAGTVRSFLDRYDPRRLLPAMLQRVKRKEDQPGSFGNPADRR